MENGEERKCVFPLKSLQINDFQSYLSNLSIVMENERKKLYILVDHLPWSKPHTKTHLSFWQSIVLKTRVSPFANRKSPRENETQKPEQQEDNSSPHTNNKNKKLKKKNSKTKSHDAKNMTDNPLSEPKKEPQKTLYNGVMVFEIEWANVRGINYVNELQTDTSLSLEVKFMQRWDFESINQAVALTSQWFTGSKNERSCLKKYLGRSTTIGRYTSLMTETGNAEERTDQSEDYDNIHEASCSYNDALVIIKFSDIFLPLEMREIIVDAKNMHLLRLLESGLPSWVLFFQSCPIFCHIYRPWMFLFARSLYVMISIASLVIGFYDLYKHVPLLKATVASLCGPLFQWVETLDMVSRVKYLGTMLFLHNFQKGINWIFTMWSLMQSLVSLLAMPFIKPLQDVLGFILLLWKSYVSLPIMPLVKLILEVHASVLSLRHTLAQRVHDLVSVVWIIIEPCFNFVKDVVNLVLFPINFVIDFISNLSLIFWKVVYAPISVVITLLKCLIFPFSYMFGLIGSIWSRHISRIMKNASDTKSNKVSIWSLWNELFSSVFRALKSILKGFVAFFAVCNRHRLSIYNYIQDLGLHGQQDSIECDVPNDTVSAQSETSSKQVAHHQPKSAFQLNNSSQPKAFNGHLASSAPLNKTCNNQNAESSQEDKIQSHRRMKSTEVSNVSVTNRFLSLADCIESDDN